MWGPPLRKDQVARLQQLQNHAVHVTKSLHKFDHVSVHHRELSIPNIIQLQSVVAMFRYYQQKENYN